MTKKFLVAEMDSLSDLMRQSQEKGKLGYTIAYNLRKFQDTLAEFNKQKEEWITENGEEGENGMHYADRGKYMEHFKDILCVEHEVEINTVDLDTFCSGGLTAQEMNALWWMLEEEKHDNHNS